MLACRESEFLQELDCPHIVKCYDVVEDPQQRVRLHLARAVFSGHMSPRMCKYTLNRPETQDAALVRQVLVLEYLKGGQLLDHLHTIGEHYTEQQAAALFAQVCLPGKCCSGAAW